MNTLTRPQQQAQLEAIAKKMSQGYTEGEIIEELRISRSTYFRYKTKVINIFGDQAQKKTQANVELEAEVLKDRLTRLFRALEIGIADKDIELSHRAAAAAVAQDIAINIFKLEAEGLRTRQSQVLILDSKKAARYIGDFQQQLPATNQDTQTESINQYQQNQPEQQPSPDSTEGKVY